jgi:very-short-patch-repair endonuclease
MSRIAPETRVKARQLRREMTAEERRLWARLREVNRMLGTHFRRQAPIGHVIARFADLGRKLVIEVGDRRPDDQMRDRWLEGQGFTVLRVGMGEADGNPEDGVQLILDAVLAAPPPLPSPTRGEGGSPRPALRGTEGSGASPPPCGEGMGVGAGRARGGAS